MNSQLIVDNVGNIVFLPCWYSRRTKCRRCQFSFNGRVGPGANHNMPLGAVLLADKEYRDKEIAFCYSDSFSHGPNNANIMVIPDQGRVPTFNRRLSRCRDIVDHTIKHLKTP
jgi:hypothetical protein